MTGKSRITLPKNAARGGIQGDDVGQLAARLNNQLSIDQQRRSRQPPFESRRRELRGAILLPADAARRQRQAMAATRGALGPGPSPGDAGGGARRVSTVDRAGSGILMLPAHPPGFGVDA